MEQVSLKEGKNRALRISKTLELIKLNAEAFERHQKAESPIIIVEQYEELKNRYLQELNDLLKPYDLGLIQKNNKTQVA